MNEQLIVKNFGPIKDATVDFKRVTVFIGPTGGGKSTLAKLAAIFRNSDFKVATAFERKAIFGNFRIRNFLRAATTMIWSDGKGTTRANQRLNFKHHSNNSAQLVRQAIEESSMSGNAITELINYIEGQIKNTGIPISKKGVFVPFDKNVYSNKKSAAEIQKFLTRFTEIRRDANSIYVPAERIFVSSIEYSWAGLMRDDIGLPEPLLDFSNSFSLARKEVNELAIGFLSVRYRHLRGRDFIEIPEQKAPLILLETASGIQSVTPMMVLLEHLSRRTEQKQRFIIEEPELNLYPTAQQGLLNWLVEKCTKGENDLTITTHSPYLLAHFNLLLYAYQVAQNHPERADDVAKIVPRESWINPQEFAAYHVEGQQENGVRSIVNPETGLISYNGLDSTASAETAEFEKLMDINAGLEVE